MKLIASDYDGTLRINENVEKTTIEAINNFRAKGNIFTICTGRSISSVLEQINQYHIPFDYIIGLNGSIAVDSKMNVLYHKELSYETINSVEEILKAHKIKGFHISDGFNHDVIIENNSFDNITVNKALVRGIYVDAITNENAVLLANKLNEDLEQKDIKAYSNNNFVAIGIKSVHKGFGVPKLVEIVNFKGSVHVIGDDYNDIPMLKKFDSYGIKSGYKEAISYAKQIVNNVDEVLSLLENDNSSNN